MLFNATVFDLHSRVLDFNTEYSQKKFAAATGLRVKRDVRRPMRTLPVAPWQLQTFFVNIQCWNQVHGCVDQRLLHRIASFPQFQHSSYDFYKHGSKTEHFDPCTSLVPRDVQFRWKHWHDDVTALSALTAPISGFTEIVTPTEVSSHRLYQSMHGSWLYLWLSTKVVKWISVCLWDSAHLGNL